MTTARSRILAITDLSLAGDLAIRDADRRARATGATLGIVHAIPPIEGIHLLFPQRLAENAVLTSQLPDRAAQAVRDRIDALGISGDYELFVEPGSTAEVALQVVERWQPGLVVIGSPADGASGVIGFVRHATTPVVAARTSPPTKRVIVGTDFSEPSLPALALAAKAAADLQGELVVVHAIEQHPLMIYGVVLPTVTPASAVELQNHAERRLEEAVAKLPVRARTQVLVGPPAAALVEAATSTEAELLVVGTHGRTGLTRFLLGSIAEAVLHHAPCSVLVAR